VFSISSTGRILGTLSILSIAVLICRSPAPSPPRHRHAPAIIKERHGKNATSSNWGGYVVTAANGTVTGVKGSWVMPAVTCVDGADSYSSFWVGIDGFSSNTVEQVGVDANCIGSMAHYSAWYEFYPHWPVTDNSVTVKPGDVITAEVSVGAKGLFTVSLTTSSGRGAINVSSKMPSAKMNSAEWIVEAPWSSGVLPLANFGTVSFGQNYTPVLGTCFATIGKKTGAIGSFDPNYVKINMVGKNADKATASELTTDGSSFSDTWVSTGP
jgi:hypothetical protein